MHTINHEVVQRHIEELRREVAQHRLQKRSIERKRKERKKLPFWAVFFSLKN